MLVRMRGCLAWDRDEHHVSDAVAQGFLDDLDHSLASNIQLQDCGVRKPCAQNVASVWAGVDEDEVALRQSEPSGSQGETSNSAHDGHDHLVCHGAAQSVVGATTRGVAWGRLASWV